MYIHQSSGSLPAFLFFKSRIAFCNTICYNNPVSFTWNKRKNDANIKKHGIGFELASKVFLDEARVEQYDEKHSNYENRFITIGLVGEVLFVVYTERDENIRLISARLADKDEKEVYYENKKRKKQ